LRDPTPAAGEGGEEAPVHHRRAHRGEAARTDVDRQRDEVGGGVVDQAGERAALPYALDHRVDLLGIAHVADLVLDAAAVRRRGRKLGHGLLQHGFAPAADVHRRAVCDEAARELLAEPGAATGDQDSFALQGVGADRSASKCPSWSFLREVRPG
jgi:hypothetical protein